MGVLFSEAGPCACRWPLWRDLKEPRLVCGEPVVPGRPYCEEHVRRSRHRTARATPWKAKPNRVALIRQVAEARAERRAIAASPQPKPPRPPFPRLMRAAMGSTALSLSFDPTILPIYSGIHRNNGESEIRNLGK